MDSRYAEVKALLADSTACRLLRSERSALIISFFDEVFGSGGQLMLPESALVERLTAFIARVNADNDNPIRRDPRALIKEWASDRLQFLRRFTVEDSTEFYYEITPQAQKAVSFVMALPSYRYVGTESRLRSIIELLKQMTLQRDSSRREDYLTELKEQREQLDRRIAAVEAGEEVFLSPEQFYDRLQQFESLARSLKADLREVEYNLRALYREIRTQIETDENPKEHLLDLYFSRTNLIASSEQGNSAQAFERLLLSSESRSQLNEMLQDLYSSRDLDELSCDPRLAYLYSDLLHHSELIHRVIARQDKDLSAYIKTNIFSQNKVLVKDGRRVLQQVRAAPEILQSTEEALTLELPFPEIMLPTQRPLFTVPKEENFDSSNITDGEAEELSAEDFAALPLIDIDTLRSNLFMALSQQPVVTLQQITERFGLPYWAEEFFAYADLIEHEYDFAEDPEHRDIAVFRRELDDGRIIRTELEYSRLFIKLKTEGEQNLGAQEQLRQMQQAWSAACKAAEQAEDKESTDE